MIGGGCDGGGNVSIVHLGRRRRLDVRRPSPRYLLLARADAIDPRFAAAAAHVKYATSTHACRRRRSAMVTSSHPGSRGHRRRRVDGAVSTSAFADARECWRAHTIIRRGAALTSDTSCCTCKYQLNSSLINILYHHANRMLI